MLRRGALRTLIAIVAGVVGLVVGVAAPPAGAVPAGTLLHDINQEPTSISASLQVGQSLFFTDRIGPYDALWRTDGTAGGTVRLHTFRSGVGQLTAASGRLFFVADDGVHGRELWVSDGSSAGTVLVTDLVAGADSSALSDLAAYGSGVAFDARGTRPGLWVSDGTAAGTRLVRWSSTKLEHLTAVGATLYFTVATSTHTVQLWRSRGTSATTTAVRSWTVSTRTARIGRLTALGDRLIFLRGDLEIHSDAYNPPEVWATLWASDGTSAGTVALTSWHGWTGESGSLDGAPFCVVGSTLYFSQTLEPYNYFYVGGPGGLWRTDGTPAGTRALATDVLDMRYGIGEMVAVGDILYFISTDDEFMDTYLWRSDGTPSGTFGLPVLRENGIWWARGFTTSRGLFFFTAWDEPENGEDGHGDEIWVSDGTTAGTHLTADVIPGTASSRPQALTGLDSAAVWVAWDGTGLWVWRSDGTSAGTSRIALVGRDSQASNPSQFTAFHDHVYFSTTPTYWRAATWRGSVSTPGGLWRTDGTAGATTLFRDAYDFDWLAVAGDHLFYWVGDRLRVSNGTGPDTFLRGAFSADVGHSVHAALGSHLVFDATYQGQTHTWLWRSDGTPAGTVRVPRAGLDPTVLTAAGGYLYFTAWDAQHGREVWRTNRTLTDSMRVTDIRRGAAGSNPQQLTAVGNRVFFTADDGVHGRELWVTGNAAGTHLVRELRPGRASPAPQNLTAVGTTLYFRAWDATHGWELWKSDGTAAGTKLVRDIRAGRASSIPQQLTALGSTLYFTAWDASHGWELWKSDGTAAGTKLVRDIRGGRASSIPAQLTAIGTTLVFTANDGSHGAEPWSSTGTAAGTQLLADINPGGSSSRAYGYTYANGTLVFGADDGLHGTEPYALPWTR